MVSVVEEEAAGCGYEIIAEDFPRQALAYQLHISNSVYYIVNY